MTTLLATTMFLHGESEIKRFMKYLDYADKHYRPVGASHILIADNGSRPEFLSLLKLPIFIGGAAFPEELPLTSLFTHTDDIGKEQGIWRSFRLMATIAKHYDFDRIVNIESDAYVLTSKMRGYMFSLESGWMVPWCITCKWPENDIQVICKDQYESAMKIVRHQGILGELISPYTMINKDFKGDRWGEGVGSIPPDADFVCQIRDNAYILPDRYGGWQIYHIKGLYP